MGRKAQTLVLIPTTSRLRLKYNSFHDLTHQILPRLQRIIYLGYPLIMANSNAGNKDKKEDVAPKIQTSFFSYGNIFGIYFNALLSN